MKKTISTTIGILIIVLAAGIVGASVLFFNQEVEREIKPEEDFVNVDEITTKDDLKIEEETISEVETSVCELMNNPASHINKTIQVNGIVKFDGEHFLDDKYFLEDNNCQVRVSSWAPLSVAQCPPSVENCNPPLTMGNYQDKKVKLEGVLEKLQKEEYINNEWIVVGTYYIITNVSNVQFLEQ
jgi:hypothetical protein